MRELRELFPELWTTAEWADVVDNFVTWATGELEATSENPDGDGDFQETSDIRHLEGLAEEFGVALDEAQVETAIETLVEIEHQREEPEPDEESWREDRRDSRSEGMQIETLFAQLAEPEAR